MLMRKNVQTFFLFLAIKGHEHKKKATYKQIQIERHKSDLGCKIHEHPRIWEEKGLLYQKLFVVGGSLDKTFSGEISCFIILSH